MKPIEKPKPVAASSLKAAALDYLSRNWSVIPIIPKAKQALHEWKPCKSVRPTEEQINAWWGKEPHANVAIITGSVSGLVVLDIDPRNGGVESVKTLVKKYGKPVLPETVTVSTPSDGRHYYFKLPPGALIPSRTGFMPGLDFQAEGKYVVAPPSVFGTENGPRPYTWKFSPDDTDLAEIPSWLLAELTAAPPTTGSTASNGHSLNVNEKIPEGARNDRLYRIARSLLARDNEPVLVEQFLLWARENRCEPGEKPMSEEEVREIMAKAVEQPHRPDFIVPQTPITVPTTAMTGLAREYADLYSAYLESPPSFFFFSFLTYFGSLIARKVTLASSLDVQPRLYTVLLGESGDTRKTTALVKTDEFFRSLDVKVSVLRGAGSAEGLAEELKDHKRLVLHYDEFKSFVDKSKSEHSVLLPMVNSLFERDDYDNRTKEHKIQVQGAALSLVAACTKETYAMIFDRNFHAIGFLNRLWIVPDHPDKQFAIPKPIPPEPLDVLRGKVKAQLTQIDEKCAQQKGTVAMPIAAEAATLFESWYQQRTGSIFETRLDTYGHRLALLLAVTSGKWMIDAEVMHATISLLDWQLTVRRECDPVDAENIYARMEETIRRSLARGPLTKAELKKACNAYRKSVGVTVFDRALENLGKAGEVVFDSKANRYALVPSHE